MGACVVCGAVDVGASVIGRAVVVWPVVFLVVTGVVGFAVVEEFVVVAGAFVVVAPLVVGTVLG